MTRKKKKKAILVVALLLGVGALAVLYRPVLGSLKGWRAGRLAENAAGYAEEGNWNEARRAALASLQLDGGIEASRLFYESSRETRNPQTLSVGVLLFNHGQATPEDRAMVLGDFVSAGELVVAADLAGNLSDADRKNEEVRRQKLRLLLRSGRFRDAVLFAKAAPPEEKKDYDLLIAEALARTERPEFRPEVAERIEQLLSAGDEDQARKAVQLLGALPDDWIPVSLAVKAVKRYGKDEALSLELRLALGVLKLRCDQDRRRKITAAAESLWDSDPELVAKWLLRMGEAERVVSRTDVMGGGVGGLFEVRVLALEQLGRFETLEEELNDAPRSMPAVELHAKRAEVAERLGKKAKAVGHWAAAFEFAEGNTSRNHFYMIAKAAAKVGNREKQFSALACALEHKVGIPPPARDLHAVFDWIYRRGETDRLLTINRRLLSREPENPMLVNNYHYLLALHGNPTEESARALQRLKDAYPGEPKFAGTLALILLRLGKEEASLKAVKDLDFQLLPDADKAVFAAVFGANGRKSESEEILAQVDWKKLPSVEANSLKGLVSEAGF